MWRLWLLIGWLGWMLTIAASAAMNTLSGYGFGRSPEESLVFALLGVAADGWKSLGPIFIVALFRARRPVTLTLASIVWVFCFAVAVTAAIGLVAKNRSAMTGKQESLRTTYAMQESELTELLARRGSLTGKRSSAEIEAAIAVVLSRPITSGKRVRGTVGSLSNECETVDTRTASACAEVAALRQELAAARSAEELTRHIEVLRSNILRLEQHGASLNADPQADLIARLSGGYIAVRDVPTAVVLLIVLMVEVVSAFTPIVLTEYAITATPLRPRTTVAAGRDLSGASPTETDTAAEMRKIGEVFEYLANRIRPAEPGGIHTL